MALPGIDARAGAIFHSYNQNTMQLSQGGHMTITTDKTFQVEGKQADGFEVDLKALAVSYTLGGTEVARVPIRCSAVTVEYAIII